MILPGCDACSRVSPEPPSHRPEPKASSLAAAELLLSASDDPDGNLPGWLDQPLVFSAEERPAAFVNHSMMRPAKQGEIGERRFTAFCPPDEMMAIAPD